MSERKVPGIDEYDGAAGGWGALAAVPRIRLEKEPEGRIRWLEPGE